MQPQPDLPVLSAAALRVLREDQPAELWLDDVKFMPGQGR